MPFEMRWAGDTKVRLIKETDAIMKTDYTVLPNIMNVVLVNKAASLSE